MVRRLFLIETDIKSLIAEIRSKDAEILGVYNIIETFLEDEESSILTQLLSVYEIGVANPESLFAKADFSSSGKVWHLEKISERQQIEKDDYYELLLKHPNKAVEPKARIVFQLSGVRYSLESNTERNYSVIQVDYNGDKDAHHERIFKDFASIDVLGELYMSLEETFARLHLKQKPAGTLQDAVMILETTVNSKPKKAGI